MAKTTRPHGCVQLRLRVELPTRGVAVERLLAEHEGCTLPQAVEAELAAVLEFIGFEDARITVEAHHGDA